MDAIIPYLNKIWLTSSTKKNEENSIGANKSGGFGGVYNCCKCKEEKMWRVGWKEHCCIAVDWYDCVITEVVFEERRSGES